MKYEFEYGIKPEKRRYSLISFTMFFITFNIIAFIFNIFGSSIIEKEILIIVTSIVISLIDAFIIKKRGSYSLFESYLIINNEHLEYVSKFYKFKLNWKNILGFNSFEATKFKNHPLIKRFVRVHVKSLIDERKELTIINRIILFLAHEPDFYFPRDTKNGTDLLPVLNEKLVAGNKNR